MLGHYYPAYCRASSNPRKTVRMFPRHRDRTAKSHQGLDAPYEQIPFPTTKSIDMTIG